MKNTQPNWTREIIKALEGVAARSHVRIGRIFRDWTEACLASLKMSSVHAEAVLRTGAPAEDPPEIKALWERLRAVYPHEAFNLFSRALGVLLDSSQIYQDTLGQVYMQLAAWKGAGQFFTPWDVAVLSARLATNNGLDTVQMVHERIEAAAGPLVALHRVMGIEVASHEALAYVVAQNPNADYKPVTVYDPACGSGNMLLAHASLLPPWMNHIGAVLYYGQDIDPVCATMSKINMRLYGLNGTALYVTEEHPAPAAWPAAITPAVAQQAEQLVMF